MAGRSARPDEATLRELYEGQGLSLQAVADHLGISNTTVRKWLKAHGIEMRTTERPDVRPNESDLRALYHDQGLTLLEIANRLGVSERMIQYWMKSYGLKRRPTGHQGCGLPKTEIHKLWEQKRFQEGLCTDCGMQLRVTDTGRSCRSCKDRENARSRELRRKRKESGRCTLCGAIAESGRNTCNDCYSPVMTVSKKPDESTLRDLYETQGLSTRNIARRLDVSSMSIKRWLREYEIDRRPRIAESSLLSRGIEPPTREEIHRMIHVEHMSYREIGLVYDVDPTAVPYWLKKHGIPTPKRWDTRRKGWQPELPDAETLKGLYASGLSLAMIGEKYGISGATIARLCDTFGVERRLSGFDGGKRYTCKDGKQVRSVYEQRVADWLTDHELHYDYEPVIPFNAAWNADFLVNGWYIEIWGVTGSESYDMKKQNKVKGFQEHGIPLIEIESHHFFMCRETWIKRLRSCLTPAPNNRKIQGMLNFMS